MREQELVSFDDVEIKHMTAKAMLCVIEDEEHWIPFSQISDDESDLSVHSEIGDVGSLTIPEWIAMEKELI